MDKAILQKIEKLESALGEFKVKQKVEFTHCEQCNELIEIVRISDSVLSVNCKCGNYKDTLRGL